MASFYLWIIRRYVLITLTKMQSKHIERRFSVLDILQQNQLSKESALQMIKKRFLIDFGLTIIKVIHALLLKK